MSWNLWEKARGTELYSWNSGRSGRTIHLAHPTMLGRRGMPGFRRPRLRFTVINRKLVITLVFAVPYLMKLLRGGGALVRPPPLKQERNNASLSGKQGVPPVSPPPLHPLSPKLTPYFPYCFLRMFG
ncbi:unnamed protein product, partial [Ectocarpus fasciculatus]